MDFGDYGFDLPVPLFGVTLVGETLAANNGYKCLEEIAGCIRDFLLAHNCILYYICDNSDVPRSRHNQRLSPQCYRSRLFGVLFDRFNPKGLVQEIVVLHDETGDAHYMGFMARAIHQLVLTELRDEVAVWSKAG